MNRSNDDRWQHESGYGRSRGGRGDYQERDRQWFGQFGQSRQGYRNDNFDDDDDRGSMSYSGRGYRRREYMPGDFGHGGYEQGGQRYGREMRGFNRDEEQEFSPGRNRYNQEYRQRDEYEQSNYSGRGFSRSRYDDDDNDDFRGEYSSYRRSSNWTDDDQNDHQGGRGGLRGSNFSRDDRYREGRNYTRTQQGGQYGQNTRGGRSYNRYDADDFDSDRGHYENYRETGNQNRYRGRQVDDDDTAGYRGSSRRSFDYGNQSR